MSVCITPVLTQFPRNLQGMKEVCGVVGDSLLFRTLDYLVFCPLHLKFEDQDGGWTMCTVQEFSIKHSVYLRQRKNPAIN